MENKYFEIFIKTCGTERKAGEILKISQQAISSIRCNRTRLNFKKARIISDYLRKKLELHIVPEELVSFIDKKRYELSHSTLFYEIPVQFSPINLELVKTIYNNNYHTFEIKIDIKKLIIIDEYYYLISGEESFFSSLNSNKKIVEGCKINLQKLVKGGLIAY